MAANIFCLVFDFETKIRNGDERRQTARDIFCLIFDFETKALIGGAPLFVVFAKIDRKIAKNIFIWYTYAHTEISEVYQN